MCCLMTIAFYLILAGIILKAYTKLSMGWCRANVCLVGKTALVTGGNSGIGYETALHLASRGCRVIIADVADSEASKKRIAEETGNCNIVCKKFDLSSLKSIREFAEDITKSESRLDILINNAGAAGFVDTYTDDGMLKGMQINHFGSFLLTHLLVDILKKTPKSRVIFVSSLMSFLNQLETVEDINRPPKVEDKNRHTLIEYNNSKLCNIISARGFSRRLLKHDITVNVVHPGAVCTAIFSMARGRMGGSSWTSRIGHMVSDSSIWMFGKTAVEGAQTTLHCAIDKSVNGVSGQFFSDCKIYWKVPAKAADESFCDAVWAESEKLVKLTAEEKLQ